MRKTTIVTSLITTLMLGPLPAVAQPFPSVAVHPTQWAQGRAVPRDRFQQVYAQGYQTGLREAQRDARSGRRSGDPRRHQEYRRGGGWGNSRSGEAEAFRRGFAEGYSLGFQRATRGWGNQSRGYPGGAFPGAPGGYGGRGGYGGYYSPAADRGFEDGYREGLDAARSNRRYDPVGERRYRAGDNGYSSRFGSRDQYKQQYRSAFRQGYDRGYREARWR